MDKTIKKIDKIVTAIKSKDNSEAYNLVALNEFEFVLFLVIEIVRYELLTTGKLTDLTCKVVSRLFTFQCFEHYYRDFPGIYELTSELHVELSGYNEKLRNHDLNDDFDILSEGISVYMDQILPILIDRNSQ